MRDRLSSTTGIATLVFALAFAARLIPVLRGGGLTGVIGYDDGVYYGAAVALVHGALPYRDFLLLHPPGVVVALAPFAALGRLTTEATGFAVGKVAWMVMGSITAVLITRIVRPIGVGAALVAGLFYAVYPPAVRVERTTLLEGLANLCLVGALYLICRRIKNPSLAATFAAGLLLGFGSAIKIWGVVPLVIVAGYLLVVAGRRVAAMVLGGAAVGAAAICGPFFLAAPQTMWRMVVLDQLGRPKSSRGLFSRLDLITTLGLGHRPGLGLVAVVAVSVGIIAACVLAWTQPRVRVAAPLLLGIGAMLLVTPSFFVHYAAAVAVPLAVVLGAAVGTVAAWVRLRAVAAVLAVAISAAVIAVDAPTLAAASVGQGFPGQTLSLSSERVRGCVTADDPNTLIQLDVLGRNIDRRCEVVVDLGGYSYDLSRGSGLVRERSVPWQKFALGYLRTGDLAINTRFHRGFGFTPLTAQTIHRWPVEAQGGLVVARRPSPQTSPQVR